MKTQNFYRRHEPVILGALLAIVLTSLSLYLANAASQGLELSDRLAVMQITLSSVAFVGVFIALMIAVAQFRKSMAKPKLKVVFTEDGKTETTIFITPDRKQIHQLNLYIINSGNAITKLFQVEFEIPIILQPSFSGAIVNNIPPYIPPRPSPNKGNSIFPLCNDGNYCVFIDSPCEFHGLTLHSEPINYGEYKNEYEIRYTVFGDWDETQEGKLKLKVNK